MTRLVAPAALVVAFAVAELTGVRPIGGAVLVAGAAWCAWRWREEQGTGVAVALLLVMLGAFVGSHIVADSLGAWPSVLLAAALTAAAVTALTRG